MKKTHLDGLGGLLIIMTILMGCISYIIL